MPAPEQALALQAPEPVQVQAPEQALRVPGLAQVLPGPGQVPVLRAPGPVQAPVLRALGLACWRPAAQQALAFHRFFRKYSKRQ